MATRRLDTQAHGSQEPSVRQQVKDKLLVVRPVSWTATAVKRTEDRCAQPM